MKINYYSIMCAALFFAVLLTDCNPYKSTSGLIDIKGLEPVQIKDSAFLYSTYRLTESDKEALREEWSGEVVALVEKYAHEDAWPPAIDNFRSREKIRAQINGYVALALGEIEDKYVLIIPARLNEELPRNMRPERDIFFIMGKEGVAR